MKSTYTYCLCANASLIPIVNLSAERNAMCPMYLLMMSVLFIYRTASVQFFLISVRLMMHKILSIGTYLTIILFSDNLLS